MADRIQGPICSYRLGSEWIDEGTLCGTQMQVNAPCDTLRRMGCATSGALARAAKTEFDSTHVYSGSPEAETKRAIDLQIIDGDYSKGSQIWLDSEDYLKKLIWLGSERRLWVKTKTHDLQFFIIQGGGEGFLPSALETTNAGRFNDGPGTTTRGAVNDTWIWDMNDLIAVFNRGGGLVGAARLERPLRIPGTWGVNPKHPNRPNEVYNSWDNKKVGIYRNTYWFFDGGVIYLGLYVDDPYRKQNITVDIHKKEDTNGCIFISEKAPSRIPTGNRELTRQKLLDWNEKKDPKDVTLKPIDLWEPTLIKQILQEGNGMKPDDVKAHQAHSLWLGTVHMVRIGKQH